MHRMAAPVIAVVLLTAGCSSSGPGTGVGNEAPPITGGKWITYSGKAPELDGKVRLVDFWFAH